jgi:hypothetical protein
MGLDMYAFTVSASDAGDNVVDLKRFDDDTRIIEQEELFYWRKFNALHGWMEQLYRAKGGTAKSFNCNTVRLTAVDLTKLINDASAGALTPTEGFFFGAPTVYPEDLESLGEFVGKAMAALAEGKAVYYDSWW